MSAAKRVARETVLWVGGVLGTLCLVSLLAGWLFQVTPLVFSSGSMSPAYDAGALGIAREVPASELAVNDVVSVLDADGGRVTHRVTGIDVVGDSTVLTLRGDANDVADAQPYAVQEADRVLLAVPYAGYVLNAAASPFGLAVAALLVLALLLIGFGRGHRLVPVGLASTAALGAGLGASGVAPWAFTSAYWTDTAVATVEATTPALQSHAQPGCAQSGPGGIARLTWTDVNDLYEYTWSVRELDGTPAPVGTANPPPQLSGILGGTTTQGQQVQLDIPTTRGQGQVHKKNFVVWVTTRLISDHGVTGPTTVTPIHREEGQGGNIWVAYCGHV
jgi:signal peptidase